MVLVLVAMSVPLAGLVHQLTIPVEAAGVIPVLVSAAVGVVVARHQPRNPLGWLLIFFTLLVMLSIDGGYYAVLSYSLGHHLPLAWVAVLLVPLWAPAAALFALVILLFPDGRLAARWWRWVLWAYAGLFACYMAVSFGRTIAAVTSHAVWLDSFGDVTSTQHLPAWVGAVVIVPVGVIWLSFAARQVLTWRHARCSAGGTPAASAAGS